MKITSKKIHKREDQLSQEEGNVLLIGDNIYMAVPYDWQCGSRLLIMVVYKFVKCIRRMLMRINLRTFSLSLVLC